MIRPARPGDEADVLRMLASYLTEARSTGSDIQATPRTMGFFAGLLGQYLSGDIDGVCLVAEGGGGLVGFTLAGFLGNVPWDSDFGKQAIGWGTWVAHEYRRKGLARALRSRLVDELRAMGFDSVMGSASGVNAATLAHLRAEGREPYAYQMVEFLREAA